MFSLIMWCMLLAWSVSSTVKAIPKRSDDINLPELQNVIQQQSAVIQTLQAKVTSLDNTMQTMQTKLTDMDSKLRKHVAFSAEAQIGHTSVNIGQGGVIKFTNILSNSGDGYDATTGVFTAPVAGNYGFYLSIRSDNTHDWVGVALKKNDKALCYAVVQGKEVTFDKGACFATSHLNVGDKVLARHESGATYIEGFHFTTFSGFLLFAD